MAWTIALCGLPLGLASCKSPPQREHLMPPAGEPGPDAACAQPLDPDVIRRAAPTEVQEQFVCRLDQIETAITRRPLVAGNRVTLLVDGPATHAAQLAAIARARHHIHLSAYIFEDDAIGRKYRDAMIERARAGVRVRVMFDSFGGLLIGPAFRGALEQAGVEIHEYAPINPLEEPALWRVSERDHRKLLIDGGLEQPRLPELHPQRRGQRDHRRPRLRTRDGGDVSQRPRECPRGNPRHVARAAADRAGTADPRELAEVLDLIAGRSQARAASTNDTLHWTDRRPQTIVRPVIGTAIASTERVAPYHESAETLRAETREMHRALRSLIEELDAVDWYAQRIDASDDAELAAVLAHNRDEEKEHACMVLEWIRRHDAKFDQFLRKFLFQSGPIERDEADAGDGALQASDADRRHGGTLRIGSLRAAEPEAR
jgi:ferritin-like protein